MARNRNNKMGNTMSTANKGSELRSRFLFLVGALIIFRAGTFIPVPGVDPAALAAFFDQQAGNMLALFNLFSGGALSRFGIFALGIMPYISSSIIMQMSSMIVPSMQQLRKEGESGKRKITQYTRYGTVFLSLFSRLRQLLTSESTWGSSQSWIIFLITACVPLSQERCFDVAG